MLSEPFLPPLCFNVFFFLVPGFAGEYSVPREGSLCRSDLTLMHDFVLIGPFPRKPPNLPPPSPCCFPSPLPSEADQGTGPPLCVCIVVVFFPFGLQQRKVPGMVLVYINAALAEITFAFASDPREAFFDLLSSSGETAGLSAFCGSTFLFPFSFTSPILRLSLCGGL